MSVVLNCISWIPVRLSIFFKILLLRWALKMSLAMFDWGAYLFPVDLLDWILIMNKHSVQALG